MMKLNNEWEKQWQEIDVPQEKVFQAIEQGINSQMKPKEVKKITRINYKKYLTLAASFLLVAGGAYYIGQLSNRRELNEYTTSAPEAANSNFEEKVERQSDANEVADTTASESSLPRGEKIAKTYTIAKETNFLAQSLTEIDSLLEKYKGYISESDLQKVEAGVSNAYANLTLRIPLKELEPFLKELDQIGVTKSSQVSTEDLTLQHSDNQSRINALEIEEAALLKLLAASTKVEEMVTIQTRLGELRGERDSLVSQNKIINNRSEEATIFLSLVEVTRFTKENQTISISEKISHSWQKQKEFWQLALKNIVVFIGSYGIYLVGIVALSLTGVWWIRRKKK